MRLAKSDKKLSAKFTFSALGTEWQIDTLQVLPTILRRAILERVEEFDRTYSRFRSDSLVARLAQTPGTYTFPDDVRRLITFYRELYNLTEGAVTPLIGKALEQAGYDAAYSLSPGQPSPLPAWDSVMQWNDTTVTTIAPITLDVGAAGKGYLVDIISQLLDDSGINDYVVDGSGDMCHNGSTAHIVGLEHPFHPDLVIGTVPVENVSLCASASNRRTWGGDLHHIYDPSTLQPVRDVIATWVISTSAMLADGLATALFLTPPQQLAEHYDFSYVRIHHDGSVDYSTNFKGELF